MTINIFRPKRTFKPQLNSVKGRTREKFSNSEIAGILTQNITESLKIKGRTLKTLVIPNKKDPEGSNSINGAGKGVLLEHLSKFFNVVKTEEYQEVEYKLQKLVA